MPKLPTQKISYKSEATSPAISSTAEVTLILSITKFEFEGVVTWEGQITEDVPTLIYSSGTSPEEVKERTIAKLKELGLHGKLTVTYPQRTVVDDKATEKQARYAAHLAMTRTTMPGTEEELVSQFLQWNKRSLSRWIDGTKKMPKKSEPEKPVEVPVQTAEKKTKVIVEGMYKVGETIYKVVRAVNGSGFLYVKKLVHKNGARGSFQRVREGGMKLLAAEGVRLTEEEAKEFGALYGFCCCCGRTLTDEISIKLGIGPVCHARYFPGTARE